MFAKNIGAVVCWAGYGYGDKGECESLGPDYVVWSLDEVRVLVERAEAPGNGSH